ncbi:dethiobiotin synthase [Pseudonocardia xinjiangensis]|uniref:ATP-dependent dethiobiotin synthetase BioD n=1 Tax=Pseudonocardia xinjiangensis TaxID=75289 RepID=A0ABX1RLT8_9PSEU|nr:dethiobiotin synthase [Pseudonocardia xinjiangensis]NMH81361.1 ATP-dependent dethiobiotin synthetase BioD [Pseudonocardia xinjiangensis]
MTGGRVLVVSGTGTGVGKTVVTAAVAALARARRERVAVLKPAQTGVGPDEPGDLADVARLVPGITPRELARYPDPLAPATAARRAGAAPVTPKEAAEAARELAAGHDLVLVEGAGGLLVRFDDDGGTLADTAAALDVPVLVVATAGLGTLNHTALTVEALRARGLTCPGVVVGAWPADPDLAAVCNLVDLPAVTGVPLLGAMPDGAGALPAEEFAVAARHGLGAALGGEWQTAHP